MAKLVDVFRIENTLSKRQLPLIVDENIIMVLDLNGMGIVCDSPLVKGRGLDEFLLKYNVLTIGEMKQAFEVPCKELLAILSQTVPCVGCRRSVERLFYQLVKSGHDALDPLAVTAEGVLTIKMEQLKQPQILCTLLSGHSARLSNLVESQPRSKKSRRCNLHSLDSQRSRPITSAWRDVWKCMGPQCKDEVLLIEASTLLVTLETYLRKHRFCGECRTKVMRAYTLLVEEADPTQEKGYVPALYFGIKRCLPEKHIHLQRKTEYIANLIARAEPELMGSRRERHAKTIEIAQEEVLTCLGLCVHERLHRIQLRLREEECTCQVLAAVAVEALCRSFETAVEVKQGVSRLELLYEQLAKEELVKQQKKEHKKQKRRKKKEKKAGLDNNCDCECDENCEESLPCVCPVSKSSSPNGKSPPTCNSECDSCQRNKTEVLLGKENGNFVQVVKSPRKSFDKQSQNCKSTRNCSVEELPAKHAPDTLGNMSELISLSPCQSCKSAQDLDTARTTKSHVLSAAWSSSEHSQDCGYSSENNNGSVSASSSQPSSPEGSDIACSEGLCNHDQTSLRQGNVNAVVGGGLRLTLQQMLEDSCSSDDGEESYLSAAEVQEFQSKMHYVREERQALRQTLKERFDKLCIRPSVSRISHCASN